MMQNVRFLFGVLTILFSIAASSGRLYSQQDSLHVIDVVRLDRRFDKLVPFNVKIEKMAGGHKWVEGPVWNRKEKYLLFSDIPNNSIYKWQEGRGECLFLNPSGYTGKAPFEGPEPGSNGLAYDPDGRLVLAEHGDRRIARLEKNGRKTTLVDRYEGKRINSPNDLIFKSNGDLYFTDPPFGLPKSFDDPRKELAFQGATNSPRMANSHSSRRISKLLMGLPSRQTRRNFMSAMPTPAMRSGWSMT